MSDQPVVRTRFEHFVEKRLDTVVFLVVIWSVSMGLGMWVIALWPGLLTTDWWVQVGWGLLCGVVAWIVAHIVATLTKRWAHRWVVRRSIQRLFRWQVERWRIDR